MKSKSPKIAATVKIECHRRAATTLVESKPCEYQLPRALVTLLPNLLSLLRGSKSEGRIIQARMINAGSDSASITGKPVVTPTSSNAQTKSVIRVGFLES